MASMRENPKAQIYDQFARIGKALASPARLEILDRRLAGHPVATLSDTSAAVTT